MVYPLPEVALAVRVLKWGVGKANLMYELQPGVEAPAFMGDEMTVYDHMDEYEAAEVQIKKMDATSVQLLERGAVREQECDFCGSTPGEPCRFSTTAKARGQGSAIQGAHIARQFAALRAGWTLDEEVLMYGDGRFYSPKDTYGRSPGDINLEDLIGTRPVRTNLMDAWSDLVSTGGAALQVDEDASLDDLIGSPR